MPQSVTDAQIVAATFRTISDADGFDELLQVWGKRLEAQLAEGRLGELEPEMREHINMALAQFRKHQAIPEGNPVDDAIRRTTPAMVVSPDGLVIAVNEAGVGVFGVLQGRSLDDRWLDPRSREDYEAIRRSARRRSNRKQAILRFISKQGESRLAEAVVIDAAGEQSGLVAIQSIDVEWTPAVYAVLREAFDLTEAECEIARAFFETRDSAVIAADRRTSVHTVRTQLRTIQVKTDAGSQTDLVRLLTLLAHSRQAEKSAEIVVWHDPWGNERVADGPDGMKVAYSWTGDPDGHDVLVVPSIMHGYAFPEAIEAMLKDEGVRLWAIQRPGMGQSAAQEYSRQTEMDALQAVIEQNNMRDVVLVSLTGTIEPINSVLRNPEAYKSVIMAGMVSPPTKAVRSMMPRMEVAMNGACRKSPLLGRLMVEIAMRNARTKGLDWLCGRMFGNSPADLACLTDPAMRPLLRNAFAFNLTFDPAMLAWTVGATLEPWSLPIEDLAVPVHALVGDDVAYHHPPSIEEFAARSENFTWEAVPGCGLKMLYQRPELIADHIVQAVRA